MPLARLILILLGVVLAAGLTIGAAALVGGSIEMPGAGLILVPLTLIAAILLRVLVQRRRTSNDGDGRG